MDWPAEDLETVPCCPVCASRDRATLHRALRDRAFAIAPGEWTLVRCRSCDSAYLDPRPSAASLPRAYSGAYYTHVPPQPEPAPAGIAARVRRALRNGYANARFGLSLEPAAAVGAPLVRALPPLRARIDRFFRHVALPHRGARLLDVGCGNGEFVLRARDLGWSAAGIDIDPAAVEVARSAGLDVQCMTVAQAARRDSRSWDAVFASHVLEHVYDPPAFLRHARDLLRPGGVLWLATPNLLASGHARFGPFWLGLDPPRHLVLFTRASLEAAVAAAGFGELRFPAPGASTCDLWSPPMRGGGLPNEERLLPYWRGVVTLVRPHLAEELVLVARREA